MKINRLTFQNINALRGKFEIDFQSAPLGSAGLFAITGPTGSGKSTLLDIITLALFNQVPRLGKITKTIIEAEGAILTRNTTEAFAEVEYSCATGTYRSRWSIGINRNGHLNDYQMDLIDAEGVSLSLKKSEIPAKNEMLIGLNYDQFIKSILLSQGEFARFLKADANERSLLLEKITGASLYREIGKLAFVKAQKAQHALELKQAELATIQFLPEAEVKQLETNLHQLAVENDTLQTQLNQHRQHLQVKRELTTLTKQQQQLIQQKTILESELTSFENNRLRLVIFEKARPLLPALRLIEEKENNLRQREQTIAMLKQQSIENQNDQTNWIRLAQPLLDAQTEATQEALRNQLQAFQTLRNQKQTVETALNALSKSVVEQFKLLDNQLQTAIKSSANVPILIEEHIQTIQSTLHAMPSEAHEPQQIQTHIQRYEQHLKSAALIQSLTEKLSEKTKQQADITLQKEAYNTDLQAQKPTLTLVQEHIHALTEELKLAENRQLLEVKMANLTELRQELEPNTPCPLCGALDHPFVTHSASVPNQAASHVITLKKQIKAQEQQLQTLQTNEKTWQLQITRLENERVSVSEIHKQLEQQLIQAQSALPALQTQTLDSLVLQTETAIANLKKAEVLHQQLKSLSILRDQYDELTRLRKQLELHKQELETQFPHEQFEQKVTTLIEQWPVLQQTQASLEDQLAREQTHYTYDQTELSKHEAELNHAIQQAEFASKEALVQAIIPEATYQKWLKTAQKLDEQYAILNSDLNQISTRLHQVEQADQTQTPLDALEKLISETQIRYDAQLQEMGEIKQKLKNHSEQSQKAKLLQDELQALQNEERKWAMVKQLIGDANGNKFSKIVQAITLKQLLHMANQRLKLLSNRYKICIPSDANQDLEIEDAYIANSKRSVKTLSGGETFLLSLALALGLSDLASRNVSLDCLFIDEGFGTLDPETLDLAMGTLEKLQAESNKMIGIISHVETLKERIQCQIQLERVTGGFSTLKILA